MYITDIPELMKEWDEKLKGKNLIFEDFSEDFFEESFDPDECIIKSEIYQ